MKYYIDEHGNRHNSLPRIWNGTTPFNELRAQEAGWQFIEEPDPVPMPEDTTERDNAERAIVNAIFALAQKYDAVEDVKNLVQNNSFDIPALLQLTIDKGVTQEDLTVTETNILILARHLEALVGGTWGEAWEGLKSRISSYLTL